MKAKLLDTVILLGTSLKIEKNTIVDCELATNIPKQKEPQYFIQPENSEWGESSILVNKSELFFYPDCYLYIYNCRTGEEFIQEIKGNMVLNLEKRVDHWIKKQFAGELKRDGKIMRKLDGEYYARIITDGRSPISCVSWDGGGFFTKMTY